MTLAEIGAHLVGGFTMQGPIGWRQPPARIAMVIVPGAADTIVLPQGSGAGEVQEPAAECPQPHDDHHENHAGGEFGDAKFIAEKLNKAEGPVCVIFLWEGSPASTGRGRSSTTLKRTRLSSPL